MTEHKIVPSVATDEMVAAALKEITYDRIFDDNEFVIDNPKETIEAALSAAPDTSHLVVVERERLLELLNGCEIPPDVQTEAQIKYVEALARLRAKLEGK